MATTTASTLPPDWFEKHKCRLCEQRVGMTGSKICSDCFHAAHVLCRDCCWDDRCDKPEHFYRPKCPKCKGRGWFSIAPKCPCGNHAHEQADGVAN